MNDLGKFKTECFFTLVQDSCGKLSHAKFLQNLRCVSQTVFCLFCKIMQKCSWPNFDMFANFCKLIESNYKVLQRGCNIFALSFGKRQQRICKPVAKNLQTKEKHLQDFCNFLENNADYFSDLLQNITNYELVANILQTDCKYFAISLVKRLQHFCKIVAYFLQNHSNLQIFCKLVASILQYPP